MVLDCIDDHRIRLAAGVADSTIDTLIDAKHIGKTVCCQLSIVSCPFDHLYICILRSRPELDFPQGLTSSCGEAETAKCLAFV